jgi:hypothetical protein
MRSGQRRPSVTVAASGSASGHGRAPELLGLLDGAELETQGNVASGSQRPAEIAASELARMVEQVEGALRVTAYSVCRLKGTRANNNPGG